MIDPEEILEKLSVLRSRGGPYAVFGADVHRYELNAVAPASAIDAFEAERRTRLPGDYREFLLRCGNGGAGPYYGLFPLGLFDGSGRTALEPWSEGDGFAGILSRPFPHRVAWNLPDVRFMRPEFVDERAEDEWCEALDKECWRPDLVDGAFPICHQGCAYRNLLVVSGPEHGRIWLDARASEGGIVPVTDSDGNRLSFAAWYTSWLDAALAGRDFEQALVDVKGRR